MTNLPSSTTSPTLSLCAETAADLMAPSPISIQEDANIHEAIMLLTDKGYSAAPVIDEAGRPVGVISQSDIVIHQREKVEYLASTPQFYRDSELQTQKGERLREGFQVENVDTTEVRDIMTPAVFSVPPDLPANRVVNQMLALNVHRLFVVDESGVLVGVISAMDVLRRLQ